MDATKDGLMKLQTQVTEKYIDWDKLGTNDKIRSNFVSSLYKCPKSTKTFTIVIGHLEILCVNH